MPIAVPVPSCRHNELHELAELLSQQGNWLCDGVVISRDAVVRAAVTHNQSNCPEP